MAGASPLGDAVAVEGQQPKLRRASDEVGRQWWRVLGSLDGENRATE
jgi:hypothetical protein